MHLKQGSAPSASAAAECDDPHHIYENICCSKSLADSKCSAAHFQDELHIASGIYIEPLPQAVSERTGDGYLGKHPDKPTPTRKVSSRPREICTNDASAHHTRSGSDYTEVRPRSLWFGLDLSGAFWAIPSKVGLIQYLWTLMADWTVCPILLFQGYTTFIFHRFFPPFSFSFAFYKQ